MNLLEHAQRELDLLNEDEPMKSHLLELVKTFASGGHSGGSAMYAIIRLNQLLQYQNLTPITSKPEEWFYHGETTSGHPGGLWQNIRNPAVFSKDAGVTWYNLDEKGMLPKDVWPDADANGLRKEIRRQWPQLANALDRECSITEDEL